LLTAKAALEERLLRFDDAAADYTALYELAYHDAHWMEKTAEMRARQGKPEQAVQALKTAFVDGRPENPGKYFTVADRLEGWNMLAPARGEELIARARVVRSGKTLTVCTADVFGRTGEVETHCATMLATIMCLAGKSDRGK